jgi:hypothetical protein
MGAGTNRTFTTMLNDFLPNELLKEEMVRRDFLLNKIEKDDTWVGASNSSGNGGNLIVPFKAAGASSVSYGSLSASNDISEDNYVRGQISVQPEVWGSMIFNHRDLMEHDKVSEQNFLKLLPDAINDFMDYIKNVVSVNLLNGSNFAATTAASTVSGGVLTVDRPDRFVIGQKIYVAATTPAYQLGYVTAIDVNAGTVTVATSRGGATLVDFSANNVANAASIYNDGAQITGQPFSSLRNALLSAANGGSTTLYGQTKTSYPYLQAININGAAVTAANIVEKCFDAYTVTRRLGKGNPTDIVMSYNNFGLIMKVVEASKGAYNVVPNSKKTTQYGWTEITIGSVTNTELKFVGVQEMNDDIIMYLDWRGLKFYSNGFFKKRKSPDGIEYFEIRATSGYQYIVDICLFGDIVVNRPSYMAIMYGISIVYPTPLVN